MFFNLFLTEYTIKTRSYHIQTNYHIFVLGGEYLLILNLMPATCSKIAGTKAIRDTNLKHSTVEEVLLLLEIMDVMSSRP